MAMKKVKQGIAAALAAALVLQGAPMPVQAAQDAGAAVQGETVPGGKGAAQKEASGVNVAYHTQDEIKAYVKDSGAGISDAVTFQENPVTEAPFGLGKLSNETLDSAVKMLNQIRYIAGIPYDVALDDSYNEKAQAASLANYVNDELSHTPAQPAGMPDDMYGLAQNGAGSSNIAWGSSASWKLNRFIVMSWMEDGDSSNIDSVGHRRWLLNPSMKKTGFGLVNGVNGTYSAVYAFDRSGQAEHYGVMWPAQNMPTDYFNNKFPWSVSMGTEVDASAVAVTLTRASDGKVWNFSQSSADGAFYVNNDNYGQKGCIIFRPNDVAGYQDGDSYHVNITGLSGGDVSYTVNFFDLDVPGTGAASVDAVSVIPGITTVTAGNTQQFRESVTVQNGAAKTVTWSVEGNQSANTKISQAGLLTVAEDETAAILTVRATSTVDAAKFGEATVSVVRKPSGTGTGGSNEDTNTDNPGTGDTDTKNPGTGDTDTKNPGTGDTDTKNPGTGDTDTKNPGTGDMDTKNPGTGNTDTEKPTPGSTLPAKGKTYTVGALKYKVTKSAAKNGTVTVTAPKKKNYRTITIPKTVKIGKYTFKVTSIASKAFKNNKNLKKAVIGDNVTTIGASAFEGDRQLTTVIIGKGVTKIESKAFKGDAKLATIKINTKKLKTVKKDAWKGIAKKAKFKVPKGKAKAYKSLLKKGGLPAKASVK